MAIVTAMAFGFLTTPAIAAEPADPVVLPGTAMATVTADIDHDGEGELIRLGTDQSLTFLEVWDHADGAWVPAFSVDARAASIAGSILDGSGGATLMTARVDGRERVLVLAGSWGQRGPCCLEIHELAVDDGSFELRHMAGSDLRGENFLALDLDGDGTDELVAMATSWEDGESGEPVTTFSILRDDGTRWATLASWEEPGGWYQLFPSKTDGAPGAQFITTAETGDVRRFSWVDGALLTEASPLGHFEQGPGYIAGTLGSALLHIGPEAVSLIEWPLGGTTRVVATHRTVGFPHGGIAGSGSDALVLLQQGFDAFGTTPPTTTVLDRELQPIGEVEARPAAKALSAAISEARDSQWGMTRNLWPYVGPLPGDWTGSTMPYVAGGTLIRPAGGSFAVEPIASIIGRPIGPLGAGDGWAALVDQFSVAGSSAYLFSGTPFGGSQTVILPLERLLGAAAVTHPPGDIAIGGGIQTGEEEDAVQVLASAAGMELVVSAPMGTVAVSWDGIQLIDHGAVEEGMLRIEVSPPRRPRGDGELTFERTVILVGIDGNASVSRWSGTFAPETPELSAWAEAETLSLQATVAGRTSPGSTVSVDGQALELNALGAYRTTIDAPPWPREVVVIARDPFGGETRTTVQVIGLVDYRGLPWAPIAGVLTVLGGAVLFLRTPGRRPEPALAMGDDGQLEDIDGDPL